MKSLDLPPLTETFRSILPQKIRVASKRTHVRLSMCARSTHSLHRSLGILLGDKSLNINLHASQQVYCVALHVGFEFHFILRVLNEREVRTCIRNT